MKKTWIIIILLTALLIVYVLVTSNKIFTHKNMSLTSEQTTVVETKDFSCPGMEGFSFKYPVFKDLEIKRTDMSDENTCQIFLNEPPSTVSQETPLNIHTPPVPAPRIQVSRRNNGDVIKTDAKNPQGISYSLVRLPDSPQNESATFLGKDFTISINLFGIDERFAFSKEIFWQSILDSFSFAKGE